MILELHHTGLGSGFEAPQAWNNLQRHSLQQLSTSTVPHFLKLFRRALFRKHYTLENEQHKTQINY